MCREPRPRVREAAVDKIVGERNKKIAQVMRCNEGAKQQLEGKHKPESSRAKKQMRGWLAGRLFSHFRFNQLRRLPALVKRASGHIPGSGETCTGSSAESSCSVKPD